MAYAALTVLLQSLDQFTSPNRYLVLAANDQLQSLRENLKLLRDFLQDSTRRFYAYDQEIVQNLEGRMRDIVYKAQDVIEEFVSRNACESEEAIDIFHEKYGIHDSLLHISEEIESIKTKASKISEKRPLADSTDNLSIRKANDVAKNLKWRFIADDNKTAYFPNLRELDLVYSEGTKGPRMS